MTNRLQNLCRTVSQSLRKNPRSEFAATFPWSPTPTDTVSELGYIVGYDRELRLACRRLQDGTGPAEMSSPLFVHEGAQPTDSRVARWSDYATAAADNKRDMPTVVWEGIHCASKHRVLLMSLFEQGPQICQIRVGTFGDDVTIAEPAAAKFMTKLGKLWDEWLQAGCAQDTSVVQPVFIRQPLVMCTSNRSVFMTFCMKCFGVLS